MPRTSNADRFVVVALLALALVPVMGGGARLAELAGGAEVTPRNARFFASPLPVVLHVVSASLYAILGAFQFAPGLRRRHLTWHRLAGWVLVVCGLVAGLSGLWMTAFYPRAEGDGVLLDGLRLVFGSAMVVSLILGTKAALQRDMAGHRAWMVRGYAIGMGAGTQVLTSAPWFMFVRTPDVLTRALLLGAGWVINVAVAEWIIRKQRALAVRAVALA